MNFIFVAIILAVVGEVFLRKLYKDGEKQLQKYDREHSDVPSASSEEFVSKITAIPNLGISKAECDGKRVNLVCQKYKYTINVDNGIASVEYDRAGCGFKISGFGRIFKMFRFSKASKKAIIINTAMDYVAGKDTIESAKDYKKVKKDKTALNVSLAAMILFLFFGVMSTFNNMHEEAIAKVKVTEFAPGTTYEELVTGYILAPEWTAFTSTDSEATVEVNGTSVEKEKIRLQFSGELGMSFQNVSKQKFHLRYFEVDDQSVNPESAMEYIYEYLNSNK